MSIEQKLIQLLESLPLLKPEQIELEHPADPDFGDYSTNIALKLFGSLDVEKKQELDISSPQELAVYFLQQIEKALKQDSILTRLISEVSIAGPGFINIKLSHAFLKTALKQIAAEPEFGCLSSGQDKTWAIEHTSPNPNKAMHLGHLRNNVTAMAIANLWETVGIKVIRDAVDNNRGIAIAKLMWGYLKFARKNEDVPISINDWYQNQSQWLTPEEAEQRPDKFVDELYVKAAKDYGQDPQVKAKVKQMVLDWEQEDEKTWTLWEKVMAYSHQGQQLTLERLNNQWDHVWHEHEHYHLGKEFVQKGIEQGIFKQLEDGAVLTDLEEFDLPNTILQKSDGTSLYITQDIALTHLKKQKYQADKLFWVVGPEQNLALRQMFAVCDQLKIANYEDLTHLDYGYMSLKGGQKMSSRAGNVVYIDDLIDEVKERVKQKMKQNGLAAEKIEALAEQIALGAVKYSILRVGRQTSMAFDFDTALSLDGNSGPYLQYTHARACSVLNKAKDEGYSLDLTDSHSDWEELEMNSAEIEILRYIYRLPEVIGTAAFEYEPSALATFLYQTAQKFNTFYNQHQILLEDEAQRSFRLIITQAVKQILSKNLSLLGMAAPQRM